MLMKTTLISVTVAAVILVAGYAIGYYSGERDGEVRCMASFQLERDGKFVLKQPPQDRGDGHVNSYPDPVTQEISK
jgi:hypothetical protein